MFCARQALLRDLQFWRFRVTSVAVEKQLVTLLDPDVPEDNLKNFGVVKSRDFQI
jgi:hypothetical protein